MATLHNDVFDLGLNELDTDANRLDICSQEPTTYGQATTPGTYSLGYKTGISVSAPADRDGDGRQVIISAISDGTVTTSGTATHWALVDTATSRLLATGALSTPQVVTAGNTFMLTLFTIAVPDPA